jgi:integrase
MHTLVRRYLAYRRSLGYLLRSSNLLLRFGRFADEVAPGQPLTTALAMQWATSLSTERRTTHSGRLGMVRGFARYCATLDPRTQIPDAYLLGPTSRRIRPHIYSREQTRQLLRRTRGLETGRSPLHPKTYETLIGLLACTGMRPGEALRLRLEDLDTEAGLLRVGRCKFSPERLIPLHPTTVRALQRYQLIRRQQFPCGEAFFVGTSGRPLLHRRVERVFDRLADGLHVVGDRPSARLLDFRHTFASNLIARWARQSRPVSHHLLLLARYLGHQSFNSTWWYVSSDPETLRTAARSFRRFHEHP